MAGTIYLQGVKSQAKVVLNVPIRAVATKAARAASKDYS
jgi:hypothetical protein